MFMGVCKRPFDISPDRMWKLKTVKLFNLNRLKHQKNRAISMPVLWSAYTYCFDAITFGNLDRQGRGVPFVHHVSDIVSPLITMFT